MSDYDVEAVDRLPFTTPEKSARYRTEERRDSIGTRPIRPFRSPWRTTYSRTNSRRGPLCGIDTEGDEAIERFDELVACALTL